jgi:membrane protein DedA with SNARE-associated domain
VFSIRGILLQHGYLFLFSYLFLVQAGVPIPADPVLLIMGALIGDHVYAFWTALLIASIACMTGDYIWYELGKWKGTPILRFLCRLSIEPDSCVRKTQSAFGKRGAWVLVFAKFVPGMALMTMPLSGAIGMPRWRFLLADWAGTTLWAAAYLSTGVLLHRQVDALVSKLGLRGRQAGLIALGLFALYLALKLLQRWYFLRQLRINRVTPETARTMLDSGQPLTIIDLRHPAEIERSGSKVPGALILRAEDLRSRSGEIPREHEIILYCT